MARHMTKKQIAYLRVLLDGGLKDVEDMLRWQWNEFKSMNDYETLEQDAQRYISDHVMAEVYKPGW